MSEENQNISAGETSSPYSNSVPTANLSENLASSSAPTSFNTVEVKKDGSATSPLALTVDFLCAALAIAFTVLFFLQQ